ncbi:hypothetical protein ACFQZO_05830 [Bradyrhizobium sp. GCM10027634]|uniref:hypothetical protein n=1 Tax=unclassified Bradyrhizobium TaxID=2631580 RepID=UPI00188D654E|nr:MULTISPECIES: hypothetical protein [unclassified Bradyrhizobium]MDN5000399.1 hypothetical protein [Bradyrhizobium sp. WYCCWR 12677]QOZ42844.1 hypothetical protein XH89_04695 [Bradyrhizobium sp. CCBAU 53340]
MKTITLLTPGTAADNAYNVQLDDISVDGRDMAYEIINAETVGGLSVQAPTSYAEDLQTGSTQAVASSTFGSTTSDTIWLNNLSQDGRFDLYEDILGPNPDGTSTTSLNLFDRTTGTTRVVFSGKSEPFSVNFGREGLIVSDAKLAADDQSVFFTSSMPELVATAAIRKKHRHPGQDVKRAVDNAPRLSVDGRRRNVHHDRQLISLAIACAV